MPITISGDSPNFTSVAATTVNGVTTLNSSSGVLATQNGMTGICKSWVLYNAATQTITGSFNVSSVTYIGSGRYAINMTTAMPNANYAIALSTSTGNSGGASNMYAYVNDFTTPRTTSSYSLISVISNGVSFFDTSFLSATVFSS